MRRSFAKNIKAISPVIATIIIVAVAIVMSIAVAYWMMGLATTFTRYEKLEYTAAYAVPSTNGWSITLSVKNTGTATATISQVLINGIPYNKIKAGDQNININLPDPITPGKEVTISFDLSKGKAEANGNTIGNFTSGISLEITLVTAAGNQYPKTIVLP